MDWHPFLVHFPLVLLPLSVALDLCAWLARRPSGHLLAYGLLVLGTISALAAMLTGTASADAHLAGPYRAHIGRHEDLATVVSLLFLAVAIGRLPLQLRRRLEDWAIRVWIGVAAVGSGLLWLTGYYGGKLVYLYGVGVQVRPLS